jgi:hypothetical protein
MTARPSRILQLLPLLLIGLLAGCSNLTGWRIPGTEKGAGATTTVYLVLENVGTMPEEVQSQGEVYVDSAFFGYTRHPFYSQFVGNDLVVGEVQVAKEKEHTILVEFPGYEPFEHKRYFGTLPEYAISFRLRQMIHAEPVFPQSGEGSAQK